MKPLPPLSAASRRRLFVRSLIVGLIAGLISVLFRLALESVELFRTEVFESMANFGWGPIGAAAFSAGLIAMGVWVVVRFAPETAGSGIPHVEGVLHNRLPFRWLRVIVVKAIGGVLAIGGGLTLGREGPTVQMGAAVGAGVGRGDGSEPEEAQALIAVGAGAGLAASFNAPLAGMTFVFEELRGGFRAGDFMAALLATTVADYLAREFLGQNPVFGALSLSTPPLAFLPLALLIGVLGGGLGVLFNSALFATMTGFARVRLQKWMLAAICGIVIGLCGFWWPSIVGGGHNLLKEALLSPPLWTIAIMLFAVRTVLTLGSYATGASGGLFSPILVLGAFLGVAIHGIVHTEGHPAVPVILGMAAIFTGSIRAPVTGVLLMIEMTGNYALILPLLVSVLTAEFLAGELGGKPLYAALLARNTALRGHSEADA